MSKVVELYASRVRRHLANDERAVDIWVLVVPELIFERCRPSAKRTGLPMEKGDFGKKQKKRSDLPLLNDFVDHTSEEIFDDVPDFSSPNQSRVPDDFANPDSPRDNART